MSGKKPPVHTAQWAEFPDTPEEPTYRVVSPKAGQRWQCFVVSDRVEGVMTHFVDGRTQPHLLPPAVCEGCQRQAWPIWKGYVGVWFPNPGRICVLEITRGAVNSCPDLVKTKHSLRGNVLTIWRKGDSNRGLVRCEMRTAVPTATLPLPFDVRKAMANFWNTPVNGWKKDHDERAQKRLEEDLRRAQKDAENWD